MMIDCTLTTSRHLEFTHGAETRPVTDGESGREQVSEPIRRKVAVVGDSYQGQNYNLINAHGRNLTLNGSVTFLNVLAGQAFEIDIDNGFFTQGSSGTAFILSQLSAIICHRPDFLVFCAGHNDINQGLSLATIQANFVAIIETLQSAGIIPIMCLTGPQNTVQESTFVTLEEARAMIVALNRWKRAYAGSHNLLLWDWYTPMADPASGGYAAGMTYDVVHPGYKAAYRVARQGLIDLACIIPPPTKALQSSIVDVANLVPHAFFRTSGAKILDPVIGVGPVGWTIQRYSGNASGGTIVNSLVPADDGLGTWNRLSVSGATVGGTRSEEIGLSVPIFAGPTTYRSGDILEAWMEIDVQADSPFNGVLFSVGDHDGKILLCQSTNGGHAGGPLETSGPSDAWRGILYCPKLEIAPYSGYSIQYLFIQVIVRWDASRNDFSGGVSFRRPTVRRLGDLAALPIGKRSVGDQPPNGLAVAPAQEDRDYGAGNPGLLLRRFPVRLLPT